MKLPSLDGIAGFDAEFQRRTVVEALRANPCWTLGDVVELAGTNPGLASALEAVQLGDLNTATAKAEMLERRRASAERAKGERFDALVLEVLREAAPAMVGARYLRARLGGPPWKLTAALGRLVDVGKARRTGQTSDRRYGAIAGR